MMSKPSFAINIPPLLTKLVVKVSLQCLLSFSESRFFLYFVLYRSLFFIPYFIYIVSLYFSFSHLSFYSFVPLFLHNLDNCNSR